MGLVYKELVMMPPLDTVALQHGWPESWGAPESQEQERCLGNSPGSQGPGHLA